MFKVEYKQKNNVKPWMILGNNDWTYLLGAIISIPMVLWGLIEGFLHLNWFSFIYFTVAFFALMWMVPNSIKVRRIIISKFGSDDWMEVIHEYRSNNQKWTAI